MATKPAEYWVRLANISSSQRPASGWPVISKEPEKVLYVPFASGVHFTWSSVVSGTLLSNYPDSSSNTLTPLSECAYNPQNHCWEAFLYVEKCGNFQLQLKLEDGRESEVGYFLVEPQLQVEGEQKPLPLSGVICETVLTKCLGPFSRWSVIFDRLLELRYNMVHFTPVHTIGESGSCYSIADQLRLTDQVADGDSSLSEEAKEERFAAFVESYGKKGLFSLCDVVWNHVATNTPWLLDQPDASYNLGNSPHLRSAYCLDRALQRLHRRVMRRCDVINTEEDVDKLIEEIERMLLPGLKMWEFFVVDIPEQLAQFRELLSGPESARKSLPIEHEHHPFATSLTDDCIICGDGRRGSKKVRMSCALQILRGAKGSVRDQCLTFRRAIDRYNLTHYEQWKVDQTYILESLRGYLMFERVDPNGPRHSFVDEGSPLFPQYFTTLKEVPYEHPNLPFDEDEDDMVRDLPVDGANNLACANAGWVMGASNTLDLTAEEHRIYLRRQLIAWSDCVRLRYGEKPEDSPFLWEHMKQYTCQTARIFHGLRLDNCHTTPLPVARYLLQAARAVRPNLFVCAELFVEPPAAALYCEQLGLTCLIGEAMQAATPAILAERCYDYSGGSRKAIGSLFPSAISLARNPFAESDKTPVFLYGQLPRNLFYECSHDNETPAEKRSVPDVLPNSALVTMTNCPVGSTLGYDQLVPKRLDLVNEKRLYPEESVGGGIEICKERLNELHRGLCDRGYEEFYIHQEGNLIMSVRHNPEALKTVYTLVHTAFSSQPHRGDLPTFSISGEFVEELFVGMVRADKSSWQEDADFVNGLIPTLYWPHSNPSHKPTTSMYEIRNGKLILNKFPPGAILSLSTKLPQAAEQAKAQLQAPEREAELDRILSQMTLVHLNKILYRCSVEDEVGTFHVPNWGAMTYSGLAGAVLCFNTVSEESSVSHPVCESIRQGPWLIDFMADRLAEFPELHSWMQTQHKLVKTFYNFLQPKYFHWHLTRVYHRCVQRAFSLMSPFVQEANAFTKALALCSVQVFGAIRSAPLRYLEARAGRLSPSMSAGLPHFAEGYMRNWGRDTFIALRGLMLVTGRYEEALSLITAFGSCLRHGLIPNLLSSGENPRFNARDATWWFAQAIQDYCQFVYPNEPAQVVEFLQTTLVDRYFPHDNQEMERQPMKSSLAEILREILVKHAAGIHFREWNAGYQIDAHMRDEGFNISVTCDPRTGFIYGGNRWNCGTWMDKMGESEEHGNRGIPATPRDGADVEIIGLLASTLRWLASLTAHGFPDDPMPVGSTSDATFTYAEWHELIVNNFEKHFFVPARGDQDGDYNVDLSLISRRGIYKDTLGATDANADYMFRPNQCVTMVVAPELFSQANAQTALANVTKYLRGKLGMVTLDPSHPRYAPNYDTQCTDGFYLAKGFNYHQGPEWVWQTGYYLRARLIFERANPLLREEIDGILREHHEHISNSPWAGIPELTNKDGAHCASSCDSQAWSSATLLDTLYDLTSLP